MLYPGDIEHKLGFDLIREKIKTYCLCPLGEARVDAMAFSSYEKQIRQLLLENQEFKHVLQFLDDFPSQHFFDPTPLFKSVVIEGSFLEPADFRKISLSLETIFQCRDFLIKNQQGYQALFTLTTQVTINREIVGIINQAINEEGQVKDTASDELKHIRKLLRDAHARLRKQIDHAYRLAVSEQWVPDGGLPTIRHGRLAIPVLAEYKRKFKGFILDESATGQTVYMEPAEALEANNDIRDLEHAEQREVVRILKKLTAQLRIHMDDLIKAYGFLGHIDFTRARSLFSIAVDSVMPVLQNSPIVNWSKAKHPLLQLSAAGKRSVVPLDITLTHTDRMLLISGPNAGGKSVCLKTVGLLQYMLQCGLLIPVSPDSTAGIMNDLFIDIGDQQSIENDLSTYSSHLKNLAVFIEHAGPHSLVLLDELGSGTDPNFGGAIAEAVLEALLHKKVWSVATTHYYNLKLFAGRQPGIRNGAMRFDEKNLAPLYLLDIGKPGSSFALEIAQNTGIPDHVLKRAAQLIGQDLMGFDKLVRILEKERQELAQRLSGLETIQGALNQTRKQYETLVDGMEKRKAEILERAKSEASELLRETNQVIEKTIRHIRENQAQRSETVKARKNLQDLAKGIKKDDSPKHMPVAGKPGAGDTVRIIGQEGTGTVLSVGGKYANVQFGELKSRVELTKLQKVENRGAEKSQSLMPGKAGVTGFEWHAKQASFSSVLDVRGKRAEEVIVLLDHFLDTAVLLGYSELKILHGKGEGVLRTVVRSELKKHQQVESFADEHVDRGGAGITVVILK